MVALQSFSAFVPSPRVFSVEIFGYQYGGLLTSMNLIEMCIGKSTAATFKTFHNLDPLRTTIKLMSTKEKSEFCL